MLPKEPMQVQLQSTSLAFSSTKFANVNEPLDVSLVPFQSYPFAMVL